MKVDGISIIEADVDNEPLHSIYLDGKLLWGMFTYTLLNDGTYSVAATNKSIAGDIVIPSTYNGKAITSIGASAFYDCDSLTSVVIPNSVTTIGFNAFYDCDSLTSVVIPNSVINIGASAFNNCNSLTSITIPNSVTSIDYRTFSDCSSLTSVVIGNSVTSIGNWAFYSCSRLTDVYYAGSEEELMKISIGTNNDALANATRYYYSETRPTTEGNYWHYVDGVPTIWVAETYNLTITIGTTSYKMVGSGSMTSGKVANISNYPTMISSVQTLQITMGAIYTFTGYMKLSLGSYKNAKCTLASSGSGSYTLTISGATGDVSVTINGTAP